MILLEEIEPGYRMNLFKASLFHLLPKEISDFFSFFDRLKLMLRACYGYYIYYVLDGTELCAYTFLKRNYLNRYRFMKGEHLLINPYYVKADYRGKGIATQMLRRVISTLPSECSRVWAVVEDNNYASICVLEKIGFSHVGFSIKDGWSHKLSHSVSQLLIFSYSCNEK